MLLPLIYYLLGFLIYAIIYAFYQRDLRKQSVELDYLNNLDDVPKPDPSAGLKKPFDQIEKIIQKNFYFNRIQIIFGIDLSASNERQGRKTFNKESLHRVQGNKIINPYQKAISSLGPTLERIFESKLTYSCFGFGDQSSQNFSFFPIVATGEQFQDHRRILTAYQEQLKDVALSGPTSFYPLLKLLMCYGAHGKRDFTMLIVLTDEPKFSHEDKLFAEAILSLSAFPNVCLIIIGLGDGPWHQMSHEEHSLREFVWRKRNSKMTKDLSLPQSDQIYDNFHFVRYESTGPVVPFDNSLARNILIKLPTQLKKAFRHDENNAHF